MLPTLRSTEAGGSGHLPPACRKSHQGEPQTTGEPEGPQIDADQIEQLLAHQGRHALRDRTVTMIRPAYSRRRLGSFSVSRRKKMPRMKESTNKIIEIVT
ncbi:hypothetical protein [Streptomyces sp. NPDC056512]|uniref:hypothetical protein n=1 Tax=Streptomyces sp. NPDC056512 TaxID=3345846 RepID=UPI003682725C